MKKYQRALGAAVTVAVVGTGMTLGTASTAQASAPSSSAPAHGSSAAEGDLLGSLLLSPTSLPLISGTPGVDSLLSLTAPLWNLVGVTNSVQWLSNGVPIPGATSMSYLPQLGDAGATLQAVVTGSLLGLVPVQAFSNVLQIPGLGGGGTTGNPLEVLQLGTLLGTGELGSLLQILDPVWSLPGVSMAYQWFSNGVAIPGATGATYIPELSDAGAQIWATITGTLAGVPVVNTVTAALKLPTATTSKQLAATSAATVPTTAQVGKSVSATDPTWDQSGVTNSYQWLRDGAPIATGKAKAYTLTPEDLGHTVSVKVTGTKEGFTSSTVDSNKATVELGDAPAFTTQPSVDGIYGLGQTLTAAPGAWGTGTTPTFTYQWKRNGVAIVGATAATYVVTVADIGSTLAATVTATRAAYKPATFTTSALAVNKVASTTAARMQARKVVLGKRGLVQVTLAATGLTPSGTVEIYEGTKLVKAYDVDGDRLLTLPKMKAGRHQLTAVYTGSTTTAGSTSKVVTLVVKKAKKHR
ncbi:MAG: hypothetical protein F2667_01320 [Actinobacteria bacterium]|uniref:Unannotated protein n=1 Tax=freshwater metagenome TaxID=449393 RepID=A0A6J6NP17_9ZZZZ|nr:hypothetical protein [Actinomycetota bacterium]